MRRPRELSLRATDLKTQRRKCQAIHQGKRGWPEEGGGDTSENAQGPQEWFKQRGSGSSGRD